MIKETIFNLKSLYRDNMRINGYKFGDGEKSVCIVGATRGNEIQQLYICSQLVKIFKKIEEQGRIKSAKSIMVVPSLNPYSMNIQKRFWPTDNTDINRMFPGYDLGETTQRIAGGVFEYIKDYNFGIQFASFYMPGNFVPHVKMMKTSFEDTEAAKLFGLPYIILRTPRPYDTTTLNYNWQLWDTKAFSLYTQKTDSIDRESADQAINAVLNFLNAQGIIQYKSSLGYIPSVVSDSDIINVKTTAAGIFNPLVKVNSFVNKGEALAEIIDPYEGEVISRILSPIDGRVFFSQNAPLTYTKSVAFKLIPV
ncbi:MAG: M14 family metallopeptidase [Acutalibacteraceae bacterium]